MNHSKEYRLIGEWLIKTLPALQSIRDEKPKMAYLVSDEEKKKNRKVVFADCNLVSEGDKWCCKYDFFIYDILIVNEDEKDYVIVGKTLII